MYSALSYLIKCFEEQNVFAGILKSAALLVRFGMHHPRLCVVVIVVVGVVRLGTHCSRTNMFTHSSCACGEFIECIVPVTDLKLCGCIYPWCTLQRQAMD